VVAGLGRQRKYSDADRARALAALAVNEGNVTRTAAQLGIPEATLRFWAGAPPTPDRTQEVAQAKNDLAERYERLTHAALDVTEGGMKSLRPRDAATVAAIFTDKMVLLRGDTPPAAAVVVIVTGPGLGDL